MIEIRGLVYTPVKSRRAEVQSTPQASSDLTSNGHLLDDEQARWSLNVERLSINEGERVAIVGPSGSGKSTLLGLISGLLFAQRGELIVGHTPLHDRSAPERARWRQRSVSWQSELTAYRGALSQRELIDLKWWLGLAERRDEAHTRAALNRLHLPVALESRRRGELSQGELLRFSIARALLDERAVMLFDEPTAHLDAEHAERVRDWLLSTPRGSTLVIATHDELLARRCDRVFHISMRGGESVIIEGDQAQGSSRSAASSERDLNGKLGRSSRSLNLLRAQLNRWRFAARHLITRWRLYALLGVAALITLAAPLAAQRALEGARAELNERALETPLIIGAEQSPLDLFFGALYFSTTPRASLEMSRFDQLSERSLAPLVPLLISGSARGVPLVATDSAYFEHRRLRVTRGRLPLQVGEVALDESLALALDLPIGATLHTELTDLYQLTAPSPIELEIVGYLHGAQRADRSALFTTLATGWATLGFAHDHASRRGEVGAGEVIAQRITPKRYHTHRDPSALPLSAALAFPNSPRAQSITKMRARSQEGLTVIEPAALSRDTLKLSEDLERILRPLLTLLALLSGSLTLTIIAQRHIERAPERRALEAIGVSRSLRTSLAAREYAVWVCAVGLALWMTLKLVDLAITPEALWRAVSSIASTGS